MPVTSCPRSTSSGTSRLPTAPVAPATKILIAASSVSRHALRRDGRAGCDSAWRIWAAKRSGLGEHDPAGEADDTGTDDDYRRGRQAAARAPDATADRGTGRS